MPQGHEKAIKMKAQGEAIKENAMVDITAFLVIFLAILRCCQGRLFLF